MYSSISVFLARKFYIETIISILQKGHTNRAYALIDEFFKGSKVESKLVNGSSVNGNHSNRTNGIEKGTSDQETECNGSKKNDEMDVSKSEPSEQPRKTSDDLSSEKKSNGVGNDQSEGPNGDVLNQSEETTGESSQSDEEEGSMEVVNQEGKRKNRGAMGRRETARER